MVAIWRLSGMGPIWYDRNVLWSVRRAIARVQVRCGCGVGVWRMWDAYEHSCGRRCVHAGSANSCVCVVRARDNDLGGASVVVCVVRGGA